MRPEPSVELLGIFARLRTFKHCNKAFSQMDLFTAFAKICLCLCYCVFVFHAGGNLYKAQIPDKTFSFSASLLRVHLPCCLVRIYRRLACNAKYHHPGYCGHQSLPLRLLFVLGRIYHKLLQISSWQSTILVERSSNLKFRNQIFVILAHPVPSDKFWFYICVELHFGLHVTLYAALHALVLAMILCKSHSPIC